MKQNELVGNVTTHGYVRDKLPFLTIYLWGVYISASGLNVFVYGALRKMKVLPEVVLQQLKLITLLVIIFCVVNWALYALPLTYNFIYGFHQVFSRERCAFWGVPGNTLGIFITVSYSILAFERWNRTRNEEQASEESRQNPVIIGTAIGWTFGLVAAIIMSIGQTLGHNTTGVYFCGGVTRFMDLIWLFIPSMSLIGMEYILCGFYVLIFVKNQRILNEFSLITSRYSVVQRYQMRQTLRSFKMVAPSLGAHCLMNSIMMTFMSFVLYDKSGKTELDLDLDIGLVFALYQPMFLILHPIAFVMCDRNMWSHIKNITSRKQLSDGQMASPIGTVAYHMTPDNSAILITSMWDKHHKE